MIMGSRPSVRLQSVVGAKRCRIHVVLDSHRDPESLGEFASDVKTVNPEVDRVSHPPGRGVDTPGDSNTYRLDIAHRPPRKFGNLSDGVGRSPENCLRPIPGDQPQLLHQRTINVYRNRVSLCATNIYANVQRGSRSCPVWGTMPKRSDSEDSIQ